MQIEQSVQKIIEKRPEFKNFSEQMKKMSLESGRPVENIFNDYFLPLYEGLKDSAYQAQQVKEETKVSPSDSISTPPSDKAQELFAKANSATGTEREELFAQYIAERFKTEE